MTGWRALLLAALAGIALQGCERPVPPADTVAQAPAVGPAPAPSPLRGEGRDEGPAPPPPAPLPLPQARNTGDPEGFRLLAERPLVLPVPGVPASSLRDEYELARGQRVHEAIDILAAAGTPVVAVDDGRIAKLFTSRAGGLTIYHYDPDSRLAYYYAHLQRYAEGVREGMEVKRGDLIGYVGSSGNANPQAPHLHFAVFRLGTPPRWWEGEAVNPYPALSRAAPAAQVAAR